MFKLLNLQEVILFKKILRRLWSFRSYFKEIDISWNCLLMSNCNNLWIGSTLLLGYFLPLNNSHAFDKHEPILILFQVRKLSFHACIDIEISICCLYYSYCIPLLLKSATFRGGLERVLEIRWKVVPKHFMWWNYRYIRGYSTLYIIKPHDTAPNIGTYALIFWIFSIESPLSYRDF